MGNLRAERLNNKDKRFYPLLGPFLARREVHKAIGCPPWDDDGKEWFVVFRGDSVIGFGAVLIENGTAHLCSDYATDIVTRELLMRERSKWSKKQGAEVAVAVVSEAGREVYVRAGFEVVRATKNYATMKKELKWASV